MIVEIMKILEENAAVSAWTLTESKSSSAELFFVKDKLDMNREADVVEYGVRVYVDFEENGEKFKGDAGVQISASDTVGEIRRKIDTAVFSAGFVKNKWYDLPENDDKPLVPFKKFDNKSDLKERYDALYDVFFRPYPYCSKVNSCEFFAMTGEKRVLTSKGCGVSYPFNQFVFELVTDDNSGEEPVEIFNDYYLTNIDLEQIAAIVDKQLMETEGRSLAVKNEKIENIRIILTGDAVEDFLKFYVSQATDTMIYQQISRAKLGERFLAEDAKQDLTIRINPALESSVFAAPVDGEGKRLEPYTMYEKGVVENLRTCARFSHYLGIPNAGMAKTFEVEPGARPIDDYRTGDYLELMTFSSFQMDPGTGDFGGEFRLARLSLGGKTSWVTGGAISENLFAVQNRMLFTSGTIQRKSSVVPEAIIIDGVTVAGL